MTPNSQIISPIGQKHFSQSESWIRGSFLVALICIFVVLAPLYIMKDWTGNERDYFGQAFHWIDGGPDSHLFATSKAELARLLWCVLAGIPTYFFGYDAAWSILRILTLVAFTGGVALLARALGVTLYALIPALVYAIHRETYFGGEWIFGGVEAKSMAYIGVFLAMVCAVKSRHVLSSVLLLLATYFHFLVGGFWALAIVLLLVLNGTDRRRLLRAAGIYVIGVLPLAATIIYQNIGSVPGGGLMHGLTSDQIYSSIRVPHHVAPFNNGVYGGTYGWPNNGPIRALLVTAGLFFVWHKNLANRTTALWLLALHGYLALAFVIAWLDWPTQYFGKFYMFRPAALIMLLSFMVLANVVINYLMRYSRWFGIAAVVGAILVSPFYTPPVTLSLPVFASVSEKMSETDRRFVSWMVERTGQSEIVLFQEGDGTYVRSENFEHISGRPSLVDFKFPAQTKADILKWYGLIKQKQAAFTGDCEAIKSFDARYFVSTLEKQALSSASCVREVFSEHGYHVYEKTPG